MKRAWIAGMAVLGTVTAPAYAYDITKETPQQKCERWAEQTGVDSKDRPQYIKDCLLDLRVPDDDKDDGGGE